MSDDGKMYWKALKDSSECPACQVCTFTEAKCNHPDAGSPSNDPSNNKYLVNQCQADSRTNQDSECKQCDVFCNTGEHFNEDCGGIVGPSCTPCITECGGCSGKSEGNCAAPLCEWSDGVCLPNRLSGQYPDASSLCSGKTFVDTTVCLECDSVTVPNDKYMVNCQQSGAKRFKKLTSCIDGSTYETVAPTRTSDRECGLCTPCERGFYQAVDCSPSNDNTCVPVSVPGENEYVFEIATEKRDAIILPTGNCTLSGKWQDLNQPYESGDAYTPGKDVTCYDYNPAT